MGPLVFVGNPGSSVLTVVLFWAVTYAWGGSELFLGWRLTRRKSKDAVDQDAGSKWVLIASIWLGVAAGIALAAAAPSLAIRADRDVLDRTRTGEPDLLLFTAETGGPVVDFLERPVNVIAS